MSDKPTIAQFHITGPTQPWPGREAFADAVKHGVSLFMKEMQRAPTQDEIDLLVAAYLRHYEAEEILEPHLRLH